MSESSSTAEMEYFEADVLKLLRQEARMYQKLDLAYLAAGGAIVSALKLNGYALLEFTAQIWFVLVAFFALLFADTKIKEFVFVE
jgi:hypothetical protein